MCKPAQIHTLILQGRFSNAPHFRSVRRILSLQTLKHSCDLIWDVALHLEMWNLKIENFTFLKKCENLNFRILGWYFKFFFFFFFSFYWEVAFWNWGNACTDCCPAAKFFLAVLAVGEWEVWVPTEAFERTKQKKLRNKEGEIFTVWKQILPKRSLLVWFTLLKHLQAVHQARLPCGGPLLQEGGCSWLLQNNIKSVGQEHLQHNRFLKFVLTKPCAAVRR